MEHTRRQPGSAASGLVDPGDLSTQSPQHDRGAQQRYERATGQERGGQRDPRYDEWCPKMQKAGRETGPICRRK
jgi:hypothetical protein